MLRIIFPTLILVAAIGLFLGFTNPTYQEIGKLRAASAAYDQALNNSKELLDVRNELTEKFNNMSKSDRDRLEKLMPDNVDNIRLIIDIQKIARQYGMNPADIKYDARTTKTNEKSVVTPEQAKQEQKDYGAFELEFSVKGTYENYLSFVRDMEKSLRLVDIESVTFQTGDVGSTAHKYNFRIKTYWLKN